MAKWKGTVVPNSGYVEKIYFNNKLTHEEYLELVSQLILQDLSNFGLEGKYYIALANADYSKIMIIKEDRIWLVNATSGDLEQIIYDYNPSEDYYYFEVSEFEFNGNVISSFMGLPVGTQNDILSKLFSITPFTQSQQTTADKLKKLIDGKQYVIDKTNAKAETSLPINCTWEQLGDTIEGIQGSGGGINVPSVSNLVVSDKGVASWDKPDFSSLENLDYTYIYILTVNGKEIETTDTSKNIMGNLIEGTNIISVVVKVTVTTIKNGKEISTTCEFSMPAYAIITLTATLPDQIKNLNSISVGTNIYLFGGEGKTTWSSDLIYKFDTTTETLSTLTATLPMAILYTTAAAVETNIYIFGGKGSVKLDTIVKFDTANETIETLTTTLPSAITSMKAAAVGTNVYLFGGSSYLNTIYKFDTTTETITLLNTTLPKGATGMGISVVGTNVYLFGGTYTNISSGKLDTIVKFDTTNETIKTLSTTLPYIMSSVGVATIGTNAYLFGGSDSANLNLDKIYKFDSEVETLTTLETTLPQKTSGIGVVAIGTNAYLFGGYVSNNLDTILKFIE